MLEEVLKSVSIVLYEALCCKIFWIFFCKENIPLCGRTLFL